MVLGAPAGRCSAAAGAAGAAAAPPGPRNEKLLRGQEGPTRLSVLLDVPLKEGSKISGS